MLYIETLDAPDTHKTNTDRTLHAFAEHEHHRDLKPVDSGDAEDTLAAFKRIGVDDAALATQLQREGTASFGKSWQDLLDCIASKNAMLEQGTSTSAGQR